MARFMVHAVAAMTMCVRARVESVSVVSAWSNEARCGEKLTKGYTQRPGSPFADIPWRLNLSLQEPRVGEEKEGSQTWRWRFLDAERIIEDP